MAADDQNARGRRRWFGNLGSSNGDVGTPSEGAATPSGELSDAQAKPTEATRKSADQGLPSEVETINEKGAKRREEDVTSHGDAPTAQDSGTDAAPERGPEEKRVIDLTSAGESVTALRAQHSDFDEAAAIPLPRIISIANQKGGVGKTTTAVNLGASLAELGFRVLVIDLDPQGNATTGMGISHRNVEGSIYDVIMNDAPVDDCVEPTSVRNLFVVPSTIDLAGAEIELVPAFSRELKLRRALAQVRDDYDFTLIDCPPSLGLLTVNGLAASDDVLVPIQCEYYALEGLGQLLRNVALVKSNLNPSLEVRGIVLTMYDARTKLAEQVEREVRAHFGPKVYRSVVPRTVRISEAPSFGQPVTVFDSSSRGALAYRELAKEVSRGATRRVG
jgi:chromosome partitioning protein